MAQALRICRSADCICLRHFEECCPSAPLRLFSASFPPPHQAWQGRKLIGGVGWQFDGLAHPLPSRQCPHRLGPTFHFEAERPKSGLAQRRAA
eukprot:scaffold24_cov245-Pinguiococcus_pyrenoidosus.AAC.9